MAAASQPPGPPDQPSLSNLPRFSKRPQAYVDSSSSEDELAFGGGNGEGDYESTAPNRRQRGTCRPSRGGHSGWSSGLRIRSSRGGGGGASNERAPDNSNRQTSEEPAAAARRGSKASPQKRARLVYSDGRRVAPPSTPVVIKEEDMSSESSHIDDDDDEDRMPRRVSPPAEVGWASNLHGDVSLAFRPVSMPASVNSSRVGGSVTPMPGPINATGYGRPVTTTLASPYVGGGPTRTVPLPGPILPSLHQSNSVPSTIMPPSSLQEGNVQLPPEHPLKLHLSALLQARQTRKMQWAGLIETLGEEFRNPASHDRALWMREEQLADEAIAETMMRIKMVEQGMSDLPGASSNSASMRPSQGGWTVDTAGDGRPRGYHHGRQRGGGHVRNYRGRGGRPYRHHQGGRNRVMPPPLYQQDRDGRRHANIQTRKAGAPSKRPMRWSDERKDDAVRAWLGKMGMPMPEEEGDESMMDSTEGRLTRDTVEDGRPGSFISLGGDDDDVMMRGMDESQSGYGLSRQSMDQDVFHGHQQGQERSLLGDTIQEMEFEIKQEPQDEEQETLMDTPPVYHYGPASRRSTAPTMTLPIRPANHGGNSNDGFNRESLVPSFHGSMYETAYGHPEQLATGAGTGHTTQLLHSNDDESVIIKEDDDDESERAERGASDGEGSKWMELASSSEDTVALNEMQMVEREARREEERRRLREEQKEKERVMKVLQEGVRVLDLSDETPSMGGLNGDDLLLAWDDGGEKDGNGDGDDEDLLLAWDDVGTSAGANVVEKEGGEAEKEHAGGDSAMDVDLSSASNATIAETRGMNVNASATTTDQDRAGEHTETVPSIANEDSTIIGGGGDTYSLPVRSRAHGHEHASSIIDTRLLTQEAISHRDGHGREKEAGTTLKAGSITTDDEEGDVYEDAVEDEDTMRLEEQLQRAAMMGYNYVPEGVIQAEPIEQEPSGDNNTHGQDLQGHEAQQDTGGGNNNAKGGGNGSGEGQQQNEQQNTGVPNLIDDLEDLLKGYAQELH